MPKLGAQFEFKQKDFMETRMALTKAEMLSADMNNYPDGYEAYCKDDGNYYVLRKDTTTYPEDSTTGKFHLRKSGNIDSISVNGTTVTPDDSRNVNIIVPTDRASTADLTSLEARVAVLEGVDAVADEILNDNGQYS